MKKKISWMIYFSFIFYFIFGLASCTRSDQYKRDREFYEETPDGYYSAQPNGSMAATEKLERLKQPKKKVMVLNFWNDTPVGDQELGVYAGAELKRALLAQRRVLLPEENRIDAGTKDFVDGDHIQVAQLIREGRRMGVTAVVIGRISKIVFRHEKEEVGILREAQSAVAVDLEAKVFDVGGGREIATLKRSGAASSVAKVIFDADALSSKEARADLAKEALARAVSMMTADVSLALDKMDWQGRVAKILGNRVYINAGKSSGLLTGDILKVMSPGEEIIDPVTRTFLGRSEGSLKGTLEVTEFIGEDSAMTLIHTGGNFQEGDVVRLY